MSSKLSLSGKDLFAELILGDSKLVLLLTIMSMIYLNYVVNAETFNANLRLTKDIHADSLK